MLAKKLEDFRSKLLDKSRRNRLLNFKPKGNRSVHVFGQSAGDLYQWLVNDKKPLSFLAREEWRAEAALEEDSQATPTSGQASAASRLPAKDSDVPVKPIAAPPHRRSEKQADDAARPPVAATNEQRQASSQPIATTGQVLVDLDEEKLDRRLLFLAREAESAMQEQGCNILYASFGLLDWIEPNERTGKPSAAPLVLVPVELVRKDVTQRYRLRALDDEPIVNPTLVELCKSNFRLELPTLDHDAAAPLDEFFRAVEALLVAETKRSGEELASYIGSPDPLCRQHAQRLIDVINAILQARTLDETSASRIGSEPPPDLQTILNCGRHVSSLRDEIHVRWSASTETVDWREIATRRRRQIRSPLRWIQPSWYRDTATVRAHLVTTVDPLQPELVADLEKLVGLHERLEEYRRLTPRGREIFGVLWRDDAEGWSEIESHVAAVEAIRQLIAQGQTTTQAISNVCGASGRRQLKQTAKTFADAWKDMGKRHKELRELVRLDSQLFLGSDPESTSFSDWQEGLERCMSATEAIIDWADRSRRAHECKKFGLGAFVDWCEKHACELSVDEQLDAFRRQFFRLWLETTVDSWPDFRLQRGDDLQAIINRFREADRQWLRATRGRLIAAADARRPQKGQAASKTSRLGMLEAEVRKKRGIKPIRRLFGQLGDVVVALKPCFLMSPMSAAQYLEPGKLSFDVAIFDEASQVEPADALGAIARAKQVILVGDEKKLPPVAHPSHLVDRLV